MNEIKINGHTIRISGPKADLAPEKVLADSAAREAILHDLVGYGAPEDMKLDTYQDCRIALDWIKKKYYLHETQRT